MKKSFSLCGILCAAAIIMAGCSSFEHSGDSAGDTSSNAQEQLALPLEASPEPSIAETERSSKNVESSEAPGSENQASSPQTGPAVSSTLKKEAARTDEKSKAPSPKAKQRFAFSDNQPKQKNSEEDQSKEDQSKDRQTKDHQSKAKSQAAKKDHPEKKSLPVQQNRLSRKALTLAQLRQKYSAHFKMSGSAAEKKIALTFDDGPDEKYTAQVLDALKAHHVRATFFVLGVRAKEHPELIARMVKEGHIIGNHSYSHANLPKLSEPNFERQVETTQSILKPMLGYEPRLFRPPYGAINEEQVRWAAEHQYMIVNWNVDSLDWKGITAEKVVTNIVSTAKSGSIILQHCGGGPTQDLSGTVKALPAVIQELKSQGYQFVTVPELLHIGKSK